MRRGAFCAVFPFVLSALALGCADDPTQIVVVVDAEPAVEAAIDSVRVNVPGSGERVAALSDYPLPVTVTLSWDGGELGPVRVEAEGVDGMGAVRATRSGSGSFVKGETLVMRLVLADGCLDAPACPSGQTCTESGCASERLDPLPPWSGRPPRVGADGGAPDASGADGGTVDGGTVDGGTVDAGVDAGEDAGACTPCDECSCSGECCLIDCSGDCDVTCSSGASCSVDARGGSNTDVRCTRSSCVVDASDSSNVNVDCSPMASCEVDCSDTSNCEVVCGGGSVCLVDCRHTDPSNCRLTDCPGGGERCGNVRVCGRECP